MTEKRITVNLTKGLTTTHLKATPPKEQAGLTTGHLKPSPVSVPKPAEKK